MKSLSIDSTRNELPEGFADWPKPAQRFFMRVVNETTWRVDRSKVIEHVPGLKTMMICLSDSDMIGYCDAMFSVHFIQRLGQNWRFWYGDDGDGHTLRSMREILYRFGSSVELERYKAT